MDAEKLSTIVKIIGRVLITLMATTLIVFVFLSQWLLDEWIRPESLGSHNLGNCLYLQDGEGYDKVIVFHLSSKNTRNTCYSGAAIIPTGDKDDSFFVKEVLADDTWIIVKAADRQDGFKRYYIIDKSFDPLRIDAKEIIDKYRFKYTDGISFCEACKEKGINLAFKEL